MSLDQVLLLACLVVTSFPVATSNDAENAIQPIRRSQYGLLRGMRLKTEPWHGDIEIERDGNSGYDYHDRRSTDWAEQLPWKDLLEAGFGPREGQLEVDVFLGIQYASILNSNLRFMPPTGPTESWHGAPRNATTFRPVCPQPTGAQLMKRAKTFEEMEKWRILGKYLDNQEEECLFLNVFVPVAKNKDRQRQSNSTKLHPVVLVVHSESFESGTGNAIDASHLSAVGHLVVVTMNFRLGILGFFSTGDFLASGNYAILDLVAALQFIKGNIESFDGDPNKVTIVGHAAGSPLVSLLIRSPVVKGKNLFKRVILLGNVALMPSVVVRQPWAVATKLAPLVNCSHAAKDKVRLVSCLKQQPHDLLGRADLSFISTSPFAAVMGPVLDGSVVPAVILMNTFWLSALRTSTPDEAALENNSNNNTQQEDAKSKSNSHQRQPQQQQQSTAHSKQTWNDLQMHSKHQHHHQQQHHQQKRAFIVNTGGQNLAKSGIDDNVDLMIGLSSLEQVLATLVDIIWENIKSFSHGRTINKLNSNADRKLQSHPPMRRKKVEHNWTRRTDTRHRAKESLNRMASRHQASNRSDIFSILSLLLSSETNRQALIAFYVRATFAFHRRKIFDALAFHYRDWEKPGDAEATLRQIYEFFSDAMYLSASTDLLNLHQSSAKKYKSHSSSSCYLFDFSRLSKGHQLWNSGASRSKKLGDKLNLSDLSHLAHLLGRPKSIDDRVFWSLSSDRLLSSNNFPSSSLSSSSSSSPSSSSSASSSSPPPPTSSSSSSSPSSSSDQPASPTPDLAQSLTPAVDVTMTTAWSLEKMMASAILKISSIGFIRHGNPNILDDHVTPKLRHQLPFWPPYNNNDKNYLKLDDQPTVLHHFRGSKMALWQDLIPRIHRSDTIEQELSFIEKGVFHATSTDEASSSSEEEDEDDDEADTKENLDLPKLQENDDDLPNYSLSPNLENWWAEFEPSPSDEGQPPFNASTLPRLSQHMLEQNLRNQSTEAQKQSQKIHQWATSKRKVQGVPPGPTSSHSDINNSNNMEDDFPGEQHKENLSLAATLGVGSLLLFINLSVFGAILLRRLKVTRYSRSPSDGEELFSKVKKRVRIDDHVSKEIIDLYCEQNTLSNNDQDESIDTIISSDERFGGDDDPRFGRHERPLISNLQTPINQHAQKKCLKARFEVPPGLLDIRSSNEHLHHRQQANVLRYKSFPGPRGSQSFERQHSDNLSPQHDISGSNREVLARDILMTSLVESSDPLQSEARSCLKTHERQSHFETDSDEFLVSFSIERPSTPPVRHPSNSYRPSSSLAKKHYQRANQSKTSPEATSTIISCHQHIAGDARPLDSSKELSLARQSSFSFSSSTTDRTISVEARQRPAPTPLDKSPYEQMKFPIRQNEFHSSPITSV